MYYDSTYVLSLILVYAIYATLILLTGLTLYNVKKARDDIDDLTNKVYEIDRKTEEDRNKRMQQEMYDRITRQYEQQSNKDNFKN